MNTERLFLELIDRLEAAETNGFNFSEYNKHNTIYLLNALRGFHTEHGTTIEQEELLIMLGLMSRMKKT